MQDTIVEIRWRDGRATFARFPKHAAGFGEAVADEATLRFDDLSQGLVLECRRHVPAADEMDLYAERDPRGRGCELVNDCYAVLLEPDELKQVSRVLVDGKLLIVAYGVQELTSMYLGEASTACSAISSLHDVLSRMHEVAGDLSGLDAEAREGAIAGEMGVPPDYLAAMLLAEACAPDERKGGGDVAPRRADPPEPTPDRGPGACARQVEAEDFDYS